MPGLVSHITTANHLGLNVVHRLTKNNIIAAKTGAKELGLLTCIVEPLLWLTDGNWELVALPSDWPDSDGVDFRLPQHYGLIIDSVSLQNLL